MMQLLTSNVISGIWYMLTHRPQMRYLYEVYRPKLSAEAKEMTLFSTPFLTTVDSTLLTLLDQNPFDKVSDVFRHVPINWVPFSGAEAGLLRLKNDGKGSPANTVFGTGSFVCPGANVTFEILRGLKEAKDTFQVKVEGNPQLDNRQTFTALKNSDEIFVTLSVLHQCVRLHKGK